MRKLVVIPLVLLFLFSTGCSSSPAEKPTLQDGFTATVNINCDENDYTAILTRTGQGVWKAEFTEPKTVSGMSMNYENGEVSVKYKGFSVSLPNTSIPIKAVVASVFEALDNIANDPNSVAKRVEAGTIVVEGKVDENSYIITFDKNGALLSVNIPSQKLSVTVKSDEN